jgi:hypothetical protein
MGWTIEYIFWNLTWQQVTLLSAASNEIYKTEDDKKERLEKLGENQRDNAMKQIFGADIFVEEQAVI